MNKKNILFIISFIFIFICTALLFVYVHSQSFDYDNKSSMLTLCNNRYSKEEIKKLEYNIPYSNMYTNYSFGKFNLEYRPECIRKTHLGYYAVLISEDNSLCFVFWTFENEIHSIYKTNEFVSSSKFRDSIVVGESTFEEMKNSNFDFFVFPSSKTIATAHICNDGVLVVEYNDNYIAKSIEFFSNEELVKTNDSFLNSIPYILPEDKTNQGTVL